MSFVEEFKRISEDVHATAVEKGWWDVQDADEYLSGKIKKITEECKKDDYNLEVWLRTLYAEGQKNPPRNEGELLSLVHSELSEGLEGLRKDSQSDKIPEFLSIEEEYADAIIRIMDHAEAKGYRVAEALIAKIGFNKGRSHKHGGKNF